MTSEENIATPVPSDAPCGVCAERPKYIDQLRSEFAYLRGQLDKIEQQIQIFETDAEFAQKFETFIALRNN